MATWFSDYVQGVIDSMESYARTTFNTANDYLDDLNAIVVKELIMVPPTIDIPPPGSIELDPVISPLIPVSPADSEFPTSPGDAPSVEDHSFPGEPVFTLPTPPVVNEITIPSFVSNEIAGISAELPTFTDELGAISSLDNGGNAPHDTLLQAVRDKLLSNIQNGGTMLDPTVEDDIWDRDKERNEQALRDAMDKITTQWAKLNWGLPDGLLAGQILAINNEYMNKDLDRSREIAVKQADLEHQGMFKSLEMGISLEKIIMDSYNEYAKRALDASKSTADITISIFKERINKFNALLGAYKTDVEAFKGRIDAEVSRANVYKTQIEGLALINQIDETKVKIYMGQLQGINTMVDIYKNQVQAVATQYEAEKIKVERFKTQVEAYVAQIEGITKKYAVEVDGFKAFISGYSASSDSQTKLLDLKGRAEIAKAEATIKEWEIEQDITQKNLQIKMEALKTMSQVSSNLASGALSALHAGVNGSISGIASFSDVNG
jgi:hypothetical protein